ncbi:MAG: amidohydrolase family protein, partial [Anaerolineae bacterium]|nr:amidohydrolase family protein [Anaerolineae bacterium]
VRRTMPVIDAHQHNWELGRFAYNWMAPGAPYYGDYLPDDARSEMQSAGVDYCVLVEAAGVPDEIPWLLGLAEQYDHIAGVVGGVDLLAPGVEGVLAGYAKNPYFKGVRINWRAPKDNWKAISDRMWLLANLHLSCDLLLTPAALPQVVEAVERNYGVMFVLDHFAGAPLAPGGAEAWAATVRPVADLRNAVIKVSGYMTAMPAAPQTDWLRGYLEAAIGLMGADRLMFGSDWPVTLGGSESYYDTFAFYAMVMNKRSSKEREMVSCETAKRVYRLDV